MSVISVDHSVGGWQAVPRSLVDDSRLSLDSIGFMCWILAKPAGWQVRPEYIKKQFGIGKEKWSRLTAELIEAGYYHRITNRSENGQLNTSIKITPTSSSSPSAGLPAAGQPSNRLTGLPARRAPGQPVPLSGC